MKLGSEECNKALREFKTKNKLEELAIEVLLISENDDQSFAKFANKICDDINMNDVRIDELAKVIGSIRDNLNIED